MTAAAHGHAEQATLVPMEESDDDDLGEHRVDAFERQYLDDRSWENLIERDGRLVSVQAAGVQRKTARIEDTAGRVRRGMIRYPFQAQFVSYCGMDGDKISGGRW
jgi:hypothetical protein